MTAGFRGSSSGIPCSTFPTRSAPTSAALVYIPPPNWAKRATNEAPKPYPTRRRGTGKDQETNQLNNNNFKICNSQLYKHNNYDISEWKRHLQSNIWKREDGICAEWLQTTDHTSALRLNMAIYHLNYKQFNQKHSCNFLQKLSKVRRCRAMWTTTLQIQWKTMPSQHIPCYHIYIHIQMMYWLRRTKYNSTVWQ